LNTVHGPVRPSIVNQKLLRHANFRLECVKKWENDGPRFAHCEIAIL
jgi:hypothetical protein